ncbi:MAG: hypothetical protein MZW92_43380 [Comamonadaceae bacterium]|nr:hypothetical protein [Comamonadaceae bacterium]
MRAVELGELLTHDQRGLLLMWENRSAVPVRIEGRVEQEQLMGALHGGRARTRRAIQDAQIGAHAAGRPRTRSRPRDQPWASARRRPPRRNGTEARRAGEALAPLRARLLAFGRGQRAQLSSLTSIPRICCWRGTAWRYGCVGSARSGCRP